MVEYNISLINLNSFLAKIKQGDTIIIDDGNYNNLNLNINTNGTLQKRVTIKSKNPGKVILSGNSSVKITGSYTTFANFIFQNVTTDISGKGNRLTGCDISLNTQTGPIVSISDINNRVDHCIFHDYSKSGVWLELIRSNTNLNYALIDHNIFKNRIPGTGNGFETIRLGTSTNSLSNSRTIVEQNLFENCDGEIEIISNKSCENIVYKNILKSSIGAFSFRHGNRSIMSNNLVLQNKKSSTSGLRIAAGEDHIFCNNYIQDSTSNASICLNSGQTSGIYNLPVKRAQILNNISINCSTSYQLGSAKFNVQPVDCSFKNNIAYMNNSNPIFATTSGIKNITFENNKYYGTNTGNKPINSESLLNPSQFNLSNIDMNLYGTKDVLGPIWTQSPESSEILTDLDAYYNKIKSNILSTISPSIPTLTTLNPTTYPEPSFNTTTTREPNVNTTTMHKPIIIKQEPIPSSSSKITSGIILSTITGIVASTMM